MANSYLIQIQNPKTGWWINTEFSFGAEKFKLSWFWGIFPYIKNIKACSDGAARKAVWQKAQEIYECHYYYSPFIGIYINNPKVRILSSESIIIWKNGVWS